MFFFIIFFCIYFVAHMHPRCWGSLLAFCCGPWTNWNFIFLINFLIGFSLKTKRVITCWLRIQGGNSDFICVGVHASATRGGWEWRKLSKWGAKTAVQLRGVSPLQFPPAGQETARLPPRQSWCWAPQRLQDQVRKWSHLILKYDTGTTAL